MKPSGPLRRRTGLQRKGRLAPHSAKTIDRAPARAACVRAVKARDKGCVFWRYARLGGEGLELLNIPECFGDLTAHEPAHRRNSDPTDPDQCICLCVGHNNWVEDHPDFCYAVGLLEKGNGRPLS